MVADLTGGAKMSSDRTTLHPGPIMRELLLALRPSAKWQAANPSTGGRE